MNQAYQNSNWIQGARHENGHNDYQARGLMNGVGQRSNNFNSFQNCQMMQSNSFSPNSQLDDNYGKGLFFEIFFFSKDKR